MRVAKNGFDKSAVSVGRAMVTIPATVDTKPPKGVKNSKNPPKRVGHQSLKNLPRFTIFSLFSSLPNQLNALLIKAPITVYFIKLTTASMISLNGEDVVSGWLSADQVAKAISVVQSAKTVNEIQTKLKALKI